MPALGRDGVTPTYTEATLATGDPSQGKNKKPFWSGGIVQGYSACLVYVKAWVQFPGPKKIFSETNRLNTGSRVGLWLM